MDPFSWGWSCFLSLRRLKLVVTKVAHDVERPGKSILQRKMSSVVVGGLSQGCALVSQTVGILKL